MGKGIKYSTEKIISILRKAELLADQGKNVDEIAKSLELGKSTLARWRREFGGMQIDQAKRLKELERENARLKRLVADQALDILVLKDFKAGNL